MNSSYSAEGDAKVRMEEGKIYRRLGQKINSLTVKAPWNETLYTILKELYTPEEADLLVKMPYTLSTIDTKIAIPFRLVDCFPAAFIVLVLLEYFRL